MALPGHPLYGQVVSILRRRTTDTTTHCLVEDPQHPTFCYQMLERWLCIDPPPPAPSRDASERAIALPLIALDRFVQLLLAQQSLLADENGSCQDSCRIFYSFCEPLAGALYTSALGLSQTSVTGCQFRIGPDQRSGWRALACS